jgi:crossover junction endodeoxyribonuclease RuvC
MSTIWIGLDPGLSGAIAFFDITEGTLVVSDMPVMELIRGGKKKNELSASGIAQILKPRNDETCRVLLERVGAMPGQGVSSMFAFGRSVGILEGVLAAYSMEVTIVTPQAWQKATGVRGGKDGARLRATQLFPAYAHLFARKKDDGRADAALMAWYGATALS